MSTKKDTVYHQKFGIQAEKASPHNEGCFDHVNAAFHMKDECEKLVGVLKSMGFAVRMTRTTKATMLDEVFPSEMEDDETEA